MTKTKTKKVASETLVNFILDKSGSMSTIKDATINGFNEYLNTLKKDGKKYSFSLTLFDTKVTQKNINDPIQDVRSLDNETYDPYGNTALYDAVVTTCESVQKSLKKNQKVLTVIMTDGHENASVEFNQRHLADLVKSLEKTGRWTFVFLGANQDSWATAGAFGVQKMNTVNFVGSVRGVGASMMTMANNTQSFASSASTQTNNFFSAQDQVNLQNGGTAGPSNIVNGGSSSSAIGQTSGSNLDNMTQHFSDLGKKSWEARKKKMGL